MSFRGTRYLAAAVAALLLAGCLTVERNVSEEARVGNHWASVQLFDTQARVLTPTERAQVARQDLEVIALSGGGADGAFGAGLMAGWTESGKRPNFDIVTGVSTGALMATFVFLGPSYDEALTRLYTTIKTGDVYNKRGLEGLMGDSLHDTAPLREKIASVITPDMMEAVAAEHRKGRRLYIATSNLDAGTVMVWNMGAIADSGHADAIDLYRDVLRASASVPGFFKPVLIRPTAAGDGSQMHVDGGVKAPVLLRTFMLQGPYRKKSIYVLVNGPLKLRTAASIVPANVAGIAKKSITELLRGLMYKNIYQIYVTVQRAGAQFNLMYIPDDIPETKDPLEFEPDEMRKLFEAGRAFGRSGRPWHREPPRLEALERIESVSVSRPVRAAQNAKPKQAAPQASVWPELPPRR